MTAPPPTAGARRGPSDRGFAVIDCETTGLQPTARIIQFAVVLLDRHMEIEETFSSYVRGDGTVGSADTVAVHGLSVEVIRDAPEFGEILPHFEAEIRGRIVFAHFAPFDKARVDYELSLLGKHPLEMMGCTKALGEYLGYGILRLSEAKQMLGVDPGRPHDAASDALSAAVVLKEYLRRHPDGVYRYLESLGY